MEAILQTLIGGLLALSGAFAGPYFQRKHDRWLADRNDRAHLREKGQELFDELDRFIREAQKASIFAIKQIQDKNAVSTPVPDLGRVRAISVIYFPVCLDLVDSFEIKHSNLFLEISNTAKKAVADGDAGLDQLKALPLLMTSLYQKLASDFVRQMRVNLAKNVPRMELMDQ